ncbi:MAG: EamA family transporter [Candidatus Omnitrophica bacterium]|nr:EamA family transporter [Candidatus Omnitrophota bacterium]
MTKVLIFIIIAEIWTAVGQVLFKKSTNSIEHHSLRSYDSLMSFIKSVLSKPMIWTGLLAMTIGMAVWLMALAQADLSLVFSIGSIQYIMILFLAHYLLGEKIDKMKLAGTFLVVLGIILITIS